MHVSWFGGLKESCAGIVVGVVLLCASFPKVVISPSADVVDPFNDGMLLHLEGKALAGSDVADASFGVGPIAGVLKLRRNVEMYQWVESKTTEIQETSGGGTEKTTKYTYNEQWQSGLVYSSDFYEPNGHQNPGSVPYASFEAVANPIMLGDFILPKDMVDMISWYTDLPTSSLSIDSIPDAQTRDFARISGEGFYLGNDPFQPEVGDTRVSFDVVPEGPISILAQQYSGMLSPYRTKNGGSIFILKRGTLSAEEMFKQAQHDNRIAAWMLRLVGFLMMFFWIKLVKQPFKVAVDIIPCIGDILDLGAFFLALIFSVLIIAVSWAAYRPFLCVPILAGLGWLSYVIWKRKGQAKTNQNYDEIPVVQAQPMETMYKPLI